MKRILIFLSFSALAFVTFESSSSSLLECPVYDSKTDNNHHRDSDFSDLLGWGLHFGYTHSAQTVNDPKNISNHVLRVELRENDLFRTRTGDFYRAEIYENYRAQFGVGIQYKFKVLIPNEWEFDDVRALIAQWHATPDRHLGEISRSPNLGIELRNDRFLIRTQTSQLPINLDNKNGMTRRQLYLSEPIKQNHWYEFDIKAKWVPSELGYIHIKIDGETVVDYQGPTSYYDCRGPYFKAGIYRDYTPNTFVIYFDAFSRQRLDN
ncbi:polysaccharide lyase [Photobacterium rosenbergii]|uniref:Polysaccharide lyase n=1 Tax=Photobacterium rosenbergii TaxID=294936 RepID=A0ABU3ZER1_9GAMM|nr:polysaccharide lyase [Photobacterium rosenbergii]MDV5168582.1 polysaccharide lyase [Photobacterium rosenbergii]